MTLTPAPFVTITPLENGAIVPNAHIVVNALQLVAARINKEGSVVFVGVLGTRTRWTVARGSVGQGRLVDLLDLSLAPTVKGKMSTVTRRGFGLIVRQGDPHFCIIFAICHGHQSVIVRRLQIRHVNTIFINGAPSLTVKVS